MKTTLKTIKIFLFLTVLTGIIYPLLVTGIAQVAFPDKANGSLITDNHKIIGSILIGQSFDSAIYFSSRPSAVRYNPLPSGGTNYGLTNALLREQVENRRQQFITFNQLDRTTEVPSEMVFASASGLDPHISPRAALLQVNRIANARNYNNEQKTKLIECIDSLTASAQFSFLGKERINVLLLNLELEKISSTLKQ